MELPLLTDQRDPREMVREFMTVFQASNDIGLWDKLVREEFSELIEAMKSANTLATPTTMADVLKEGADLLYVLTGFEAVTAQTMVTLDSKFLSEIRAALYAVDGTFGNEDFITAFRRVHYSNMSKLVDGKPLRREDGKILKGPDYKPPFLIDLASKALAQPNT